ncbi:MAG: hypothetical protein KBH09_12925 [Saprospiraceae bacterium]|nr:hypothetical protein [Saprospiraceae bacterium]
MNKHKYINNTNSQVHKQMYFNSAILNTRSITDYNASLNKEYTSPNSIDYLFINVNKFDISDLDLELQNKYNMFAKTLYNIFLLYGESLTKLKTRPLIISKDESSIFIEWIFNEFRVGFTIEVVQISCFIISTKRLRNYMTSMELEEKDPTPFLQEIMDFVLENH